MFLHESIAKFGGGSKDSLVDPFTCLTPIEVLICLYFTGEGSGVYIRFVIFFRPVKLLSSVSESLESHSDHMLDAFLAFLTLPENNI